MSVSYQTVTVGGVEVFYRESDPGDAGRLALKTPTEEIGNLMLNFLNKQVS